MFEKIDEKIIQQNLFYNYEKFEIKDSNEILFLDIFGCGFRNNSKNFLYNLDTKELSYDKRYQSYSNVEFSNSLNEIFLKKNNIFFLQKDKEVLFYKLEKTKLVLFFKIKSGYDLRCINDYNCVKKTLNSKNFDYSFMCKQNKQDYLFYLVKNYKENFSKISKDIQLDGEKGLNNIFLQSDCFFVEHNKLIEYNLDITKKTLFLKIVSENDMIDKEIKFDKINKSAYVYCMEINQNLLSVYIRKSKNNFLKIYVNLINGQCYFDQNKIIEIYQVLGKERCVEIIENNKYKIVKFKNKTIVNLNKWDFFLRLVYKEKNYMEIDFKQYLIIYDFDLEQKIIVKKGNYSCRISREQNIKKIILNGVLFLKYNNKNITIKSEDFIYSNRNFIKKNFLFCFYNKGEFGIYDLNKEKVYFKKYFFEEGETQEQINKFIKQTHSQRLKTNILNSAQIEKKEKK